MTSAFRLAAFAICFILTIGVARANPIVTPDISAIYGQASFGTRPVTVNYLPLIHLNRPDLLSVTTSAQFSAVASLYPRSTTTVNAYYVSTVDWCGSFDTAFAACAERPGTVMLLEMDIIARTRVGEVVLAHELGHNLGLPHDQTSSSNLMYPVGTGNNRTLTEAQVGIILSSNLVQTATDGSLFVNIQPLDVQAFTVASAPEPASVLLFGVGWVAMATVRRRRIQ